MTHDDLYQAKTEKVDFDLLGAPSREIEKSSSQEVKIAKNDYFDPKMPEITFSRDLMTFDGYDDLYQAKTEKVDF